MLEPNGPLPPEIYWRRRALAVGIVVVVLAIIIGLIYWVSASSGGDNKAKNTAATASVSSPPPSSAAPSAAQSSAPPGGGTGGSASPGAPAPGASVAPGGASAGPAPVPASGLCPDQNISVVLYTSKASYAVGDNPVFTLVVTNAGVTPCTRDVGKDMQNVTVRSLDGQRYYWSASDCAPINSVNNQQLAPAQQFKDTITWSGTSSSPGCKAPRRQVPVGAYQAVGSIGERASAPVTFNYTGA